MRGKHLFCAEAWAFFISLGNVYFLKKKHIKYHRHLNNLFNMRENMLQIFLTIGLFDNDNTKAY